MAQAPALMPYKAGAIEPVALPGEVIGVWVSKIYHFYNIVYIEPLPAADSLVLDLGALAAGVWSGVTQLTLLEMPNKELGQFRAYVLDDFHSYLWQARSDGRYRTKNAQSNVSLYTQLNDPCGHTTEFFVHENNFAYVNGQNVTAYALTQARVGFFGLRYVLEDAVDAIGKSYDWAKKYLPPVWTRVPATAHL